MAGQVLPATNLNQVTRPVVPVQVPTGPPVVAEIADGAVQLVATSYAVLQFVP